MNLSDAVSGLQPKGKMPNSARVLNTWIAQAERQLESDGGRLGWLVASTIVTAVLQQAVDEQGTPLFLLKGGALLQHRLPELSRATADLDGLIRGDLDGFLTALDEVLQRQWGPLELRRGPVEPIIVPHRIVNPRRFDVTLHLRGTTWRRIQVEISPDEGEAGDYVESIAAPSLSGFGLPTPDHLVGLSMRYQIAQKVHASTDPHNPPAERNDRARDVVDLILLRNLTIETGSPSLIEIRLAIEDTFAFRAKEASATGGTPRGWPTHLTPHPHWAGAFTNAAETVRLDKSLASAVTEVNEWLDLIVATLK